MSGKIAAWGIKYWSRGTFHLGLVLAPHSTHSSTSNTIFATNKLRSTGCVRTSKKPRPEQKLKKKFSVQRCFGLKNAGKKLCS